MTEALRNHLGKRQRFLLKCPQHQAIHVKLLRRGVAYGDGNSNSRSPGNAWMVSSKTRRRGWGV